ncbi:MAG: AAA family ATPase [Lachnospiraceae bacterium]|nr:AAA family ATPase [Lachnospiraceae bacterium]
MKKKIYAVRKGRNPGIYDVWAETEQQVKGFSGAEYRSFTYMTEKENEDETVEMSYAHAKKQADEYLRKIPEESEAAGDLPWEGHDEKAALEKEKFYQEILKTAGLKLDSYGNSPWIALLLRECAGHTSLFSGIIRTGKYACFALYTALLYLVLDDDKLLFPYQNRYSRKLEGLSSADDNPSIQEIWHETEDYIRLKKHFEDNDMTADDLSEVLSRLTVKAKKLENFVNPNPTACIALRKFFHQSRHGHTVMGLYKELVGNPLYRAELLEISGPFQNPDLLIKEHKESKVSMQSIEARATAIDIALKSEVIGQDDVIDKFTNAYFSAEKAVNAGSKKKGPRHAYMFAGPSGVGKTFIAETIADTLGIPYKRFDMSAYSHRSNAQDLVGHNTAWNNANPGVLTDFVDKNPRCVLLFDEIEKACREVIVLFLQILDDGKCEDKHWNKSIDFRDTIVIFTTNAGKQLYQDAENENLTLLPDSAIIDAIKKDANPQSDVPYFPPEIISRMSSHTIIMFNHLRADGILKIIKTNLEKQIQLSKKEYGYDIENKDDMFAATALYSMGGSMDARNATVLAGKVLDNALFLLLSRANEKPGFNWKTGLKKITLEHDFSEAADEIQQFYLGEKNCMIAIFGQAEEIRNERLAENNVQIKAAADTEEFLQILRRENVILAAVDYEYGMKENKNSLRITDICTEGSKVFSDIRTDYADIPVYILHGDKGYSYSRTEKDELCRRGISGFIKRENMQTELPEAYWDVCCQKTMETLSLRHQKIAYDKKIELDEKQKSGRIIFRNFKLEDAVEAEDKDLLLSADMQPNKHWDDIYASDIIKKELNYFIDFLKNTKEYLRKGVRVPKGILLHGPAGTGKTSLAKVVATESGVYFLEISADKLANSDGAEQIHRIFRVARKYAPAVLFMDEVDAIAQDRQKTGSNIILNALLTEMDGFKKVDNKPVFVMAATNMGEEYLDRAFLRRFDRRSRVNLPGEKGRRWMLEHLLIKHKDMFDVSESEISSIVLRSDGKSFADLENVIEAALREAIRADVRVNDSLLDETFEELLYGEEWEDSSKEEMRHTAYHEAGHALIALFYGRSPRYMSIVARGSQGGYVLQENLPVHCTKEEYLQRISEMLGGRAAEMVQGYGLTFGASSDLKSATKLAAGMVCGGGMYEKEVGLSVISEEQLLHNEKAQKLINQILSEQLQEAVRIINENRDALERLANAVIGSEEHYLTEEEIKAAYKG